jgi:glutamate dehydrogenase
MHPRAAPQLRLFVRRDTYGRYLSCLVYLPRDRYNTASASGSPDPPSDLGGESIEFTARVGESTTARCTSSSRPAGHGAPRGRHPELERLLAEASRSWRDDFVTSAVTRVRRGGRRAPGAPLRRLVPRGLQGGLLGRAPRRSTSGRLEAIAGTRGIDLSLYQTGSTPVPGEARLKVYPGRAGRSRSPRCCRC